MTINYISGVFYSPKICRNLLSMGQLEEKDYELQFNKYGCTILDVNNQLIANVKMSRNRLFTLKLNYDEPSCLAFMIVDNNWLWHMRLRHLIFGSIKYLASKNLVTDLLFVYAPDKVYESCVLDKKYIHVFPKRQAWRASSSLNLFILIYVLWRFFPILAVDTLSLLLIL